ncbi:MAG: hypothetical protein WC220_01665 [Pedobacter sp.]|jgi:hypothetical protein
MNLKFIKHCGLVATMLLLLISETGKAQNTIGLRFTPNMISNPKVDNPSPARIYGERTLSFDSGIDYSHQMKKNWAISTGVDLGIVDWNQYIEAPLNAFGTRQGSGNISTNSNSENYFYYGLSFQPVYRFKWNQNMFRLSAGPNIRFYHRGRESDISYYTANRATPWNLNDPNAGPPDIEINLPPISPQLHTDVSISLGIERRVSDQVDLVFGIRKNWGIKPIADGTLFVQMYDQTYHGGFATRSNYIGLDLQLRYATKKPEVKYRRAEPIPSDKQGFRKAVFAEAVGNSLVSLNYDMRLKRFKNDGLGIRAGVGLGQLFDSKFAEFNRYVSIPLTINYILGKQRHGLETGLGITPQIALVDIGDSPQIRPLGFLNVGYRYQPLKDGLLFRATWTPYISSFKSHQYVWFGASIGYSFR